jgi:hypothetical protein
MQLHELLRETARRFRDGDYRWAQHAMAYTAPPEQIGDSGLVDATDERATCFCGLGGIARTAGVDGYWQLETLWPEIGAILARAIGRKPQGGAGMGVQYDVTPFTDWNDSSDRMGDDVIAALERAAVLATPPDPED